MRKNIWQELHRWHQNKREKKKKKNRNRRPIWDEKGTPRTAIGRPSKSREMARPSSPTRLSISAALQSTDSTSASSLLLAAIVVVVVVVVPPLLQLPHCSGKRRPADGWRRRTDGWNCEPTTTTAGTALPIIHPFTTRACIALCVWVLLLLLLTWVVNWTPLILSLCAMTLNS